MGVELSAVDPVFEVLLDVFADADVADFELADADVEDFDEEALEDDAEDDVEVESALSELALVVTATCPCELDELEFGPEEPGFNTKIANAAAAARTATAATMGIATEAGFRRGVGWKPLPL